MASEFAPLIEEASRIGKSELTAGADLLVNNTMGALPQAEYRDRINNTFLKGLPPITKLADLTNLTVRDGKEIGKEILARVAEEYGIPTSIKDIEDLAAKSVDRLIEEGKEELANIAMEAMAEYGLKSFSESAVSMGLPLLGLATTTAEALEDGELSQGEMMQIGASALTTASTLMASSSVAIGLGAVGGIFAPVAVGVMYLESVAAAQEAYNKAMLQMGKQIAAEESVAVNDFLGKARGDYAKGHVELWAMKDRAVGGVADMWTSFESKLKRGIEIRYFPGEMAPLRGGWYYKKHNSNVLYKLPCESLGGCEYFPGSGNDKTVSQSVSYLSEMRGEGRFLSETGVWDPEYFAMSPQQSGMADVYGRDYAYYWKTLRAFDALVPYNKKTAVGFWGPPGPARSPPPWKDYKWLASDWRCWSSSVNGGNPNCPPGCSVKPGYFPGCDTSRSYDYAGAWYGEWLKTYGKLDNRDPNKRLHLNMTREAMQYVDHMFERLQDEGKAVATYRTRIYGDLIQTANAVQGEMIMVSRLAEMAKVVGFNPNYQAGTQLLSQAADEVRIFDKTLHAARSPFNNSVLLLGGAVFAAGLGTWAARKWR